MENKTQKNLEEIKSKVETAYKLLTEETTTWEKFESVRTLLRGVNPKIDKALKECSRALTDVGRIKEGEVIEVTAERLPEKTKEQEKRKRTLLLFIRRWKKLKNEVGRMRTELGLDGRQEGEDEQQQLKAERALRAGKLIKTAKGPLGVITILAAGIAVGAFYLNKNERLRPLLNTVSALPKTLNVSWVIEGNVEPDLSNDKALWTVTIREEEAKSEKIEALNLMEGATVIAKVGVRTLTGKTDKNGSVSWTTPSPDGPTTLYITRVQSKYPWVRIKFADEGKAIITYRP